MTYLIGVRINLTVASCDIVFVTTLFIIVELNTIVLFEDSSERFFSILLVVSIVLIFMDL